ncbi:MAG: hypothetical protein K9M81_05575 [Chthoniobacterales bacterium]|nr:hypothetical protein [Chthoniobacterales bacterium]
MAPQNVFFLQINAFEYSDFLESQQSSPLHLKDEISATIYSHDHYDEMMERGSSIFSLQRSGSPGDYHYEAHDGEISKHSLCFLSWNDAKSYCDWKNLYFSSPSFSLDPALVDPDLKSNILLFQLTSLKIVTEGSSLQDTLSSWDSLTNFEKCSTLLAGALIIGTLIHGSYRAIDSCCLHPDIEGVQGGNVPSQELAIVDQNAQERAELERAGFTGGSWMVDDITGHATATTLFKPDQRSCMKNFADALRGRRPIYSFYEGADQVEFFPDIDPLPQSRTFFQKVIYAQTKSFYPFPNIAAFKAAKNIQEIDVKDSWRVDAQGNLITRENYGDGQNSTSHTEVKFLFRDLASYFPLSRSTSSEVKPHPLFEKIIAAFHVNFTAREGAHTQEIEELKKENQKIQERLQEMVDLQNQQERDERLLREKRIALYSKECTKQHKLGVLISHISKLEKDSTFHQVTEEISPSAEGSKPLLTSLQMLCEATRYCLTIQLQYLDKVACRALDADQKQGVYRQLEHQYHEVQRGWDIYHESTKKLQTKKSLLWKLRAEIKDPNLVADEINTRVESIGSKLAGIENERSSAAKIITTHFNAAHSFFKNEQALNQNKLNSARDSLVELQSTPPKEKKKSGIFYSPSKNEKMLEDSKHALQAATSSDHISKSVGEIFSSSITPFLDRFEKYYFDSSTLFDLAEWNTLCGDHLMSLLEADTGKMLRETSLLHPYLVKVYHAARTRLVTAAQGLEDMRSILAQLHDCHDEKQITQVADNLKKRTDLLQDKSLEELTRCIADASAIHEALKSAQQKAELWIQKKLALDSSERASFLQAIKALIEQFEANAASIWLPGLRSRLV